VNEQPVYTADEFEAESRYIDTLIWESIVVVPGAKVLICGYGPDGAYVQRAIDAGGIVTVIEHRADEINRFSKLDAKLLRGSTSVIPAKDNSFDLAIAFHYLHEIDPFFHSQVLSELARVARRVALIEPAPPADPLGKRIALLYSQAKRELGQFEYYQPLEYWKKLLQSVKADVSQHVFAFAKTPPQQYLNDTVKLLLDTIEIEEAPREYMNELRQIAQRSEAQLLPPPRYVLVGAAVGDLLVPSFTPRLPSRRKAAATPKSLLPAPSTTPAAMPVVSAQSGYEMPPVSAPVGMTPPQTIEPERVVPPQPAMPAPAPGMPFTAPPPPQPGPGPAPAGAPFGMPFATPPGAPAETPGFGFGGGGVPNTEAGWQWEPPEGGEEPPLP
jgi:hypothetical protein